MPKVPRISAKQALKAFHHLGFNVVRQRGSHMILQCGDRGCVLPNHREVKPGTLASALKQAEISIEEFINAL